MTTRRISSQELHSLRNDIPIDAVIKNALDIPWKNTQGCFRFLCPLCHEFNTSINPATNLARCFRCEKNFNSIDLVMMITRRDFISSIRFLRTYQSKNHNRTKQLKPNTKSHKGSASHIRNVLKPIMTQMSSTASSRESGENLSDRVMALEKKLEWLGHRIEEIAKLSS